MRLFQNKRTATLSEKVTSDNMTETDDSPTFSNKYLKYALGEILLVVIGILIAISVSEWHKNYLNNQTEQKLLTELKQGLIRDKNLVENELKNISEAILKLQKLDSLLKNRIPALDDELNYLFGTVYGMRQIKLNKALYEELKTVGLGIVRDSELKSQIINVFENDYVAIESLDELEYSVNQVNRPYYLQNFVSIRFAQYAIPNNIKEVWNDTYYKNIVYYRLVTLEGNQVDVYNTAISNMDSLIQLIDRNLKDK